MVALIKSTALSGYCKLVTELGGDPEVLLRRCHLDPETVHNLNGVISHKAEICAIERAARELHCEDFGLQLGGRQDIYMLGPAAAVALTANSVGDALEKINDCLHWFSPANELRIERDIGGGKSIVQYKQDSSLPHCRQAHEHALAVIANILHTLVGPEFRPLEVRLCFQSPLPASHYLAVFHAPMRFCENLTGLVVRRRDLSRSVQHQSEHLHRLLDTFTQEVLSDHSLDLARQVEYLIENLLPTHNCSLSTISYQLGINPRTLQRELATRDTSFERMLDATRKTLADQYLAEYEMPLLQVASLLGYSEQSCLNRACKRWFDCSPTQRRLQLRH